MRVDARIDAQGAIKGRYQGPACFVDYVWHKRGASASGPTSRTTRI
jgi:hypothetical protein